jgi:hypothetical protein
MMKLVSLKASKDEVSEGMATPDGYPFSTSISFETDVLKKLGVKKLPTPGDEWHLMAVADVTSVNKQGEESRVGLQIKMLAVTNLEGPDKGEVETPASEIKESKAKPAKGGLVGE